MGEALPIGFVLGTKPASSLEFYVLVDQHNYLEMDDVVFVRSAVEGASRVEKRVTGNASIRVNGRLDFAESQSPEYDYLPKSFRLRSTIIKPGTMIVPQPDIPTPVLINFPLPAWATCGEEVEEKDLDNQA